MDKKQIIASFASKPEKIIFTLYGGRQVIGEWVDKQNRLFYVIKDKGKYSVERAWNQQIIERHALVEPDVHVRKIK